MMPLFDKKEHDKDQKSYEGRQHALELLQDTCVKGGVCAACGASAGMYLSGLATRGLGYDKKRFLELAAEVWEDLERQNRENPVN
jgi:hypothetical protein